ncbi:MAG: FtsQ-type POTRA domain-containing protein [Pseudomonadota bacterium]
MRPLNAEKRSAQVEETGGRNALSATGGIFARLLRRGVRKTQAMLNGRRYATKRAAMLAGLAVVMVGAGYTVFKPHASGTSVTTAMVTQAGFSVRSIVVHGNREVDQKSIEFALTPQLQNSIFSFDAVQARAALLENPWLKSASVKKVYPDTVVVDVIERRPFAFWKASNSITVIARDGVVLGEASPEHLRYPQVVGQGANYSASEFIAVVSKFPAIVDRASGFVRVADRRWDIVLRDGPKVLLPEENWKAALVDLDSMQKRKGILDRNLVQIDMRLPDRFVLRLQSDSAEQRRERLDKLLKRSWHRT